MSDSNAGTSAMNIGQAARRAQVSAKMVRHYESLGLLPAVQRTDAGYRLYTEQQVHTLRFIRRARDLGFSMPEIAELLRLWQDKRRPSGQVKRIAALHMSDLDQRIAELTAMRRTLQHLVDCCHGDHRPDCPILDELGQDRSGATHAGAHAPPAARATAARRVRAVPR
jgi:MerR family transcriptional regulator, copper efflux regulator